MSEVNNKPQSDDEVTGVAAYFIRNKVISWMLSLIFLIGGVSAVLWTRSTRRPRVHY